MDSLLPLTGTGKYTPKNWIRLANLYAELTLLYIHEPSRHFFPDADDGVEAVKKVIWQVLGSIESVAVVGYDGKVQRIEIDEISPANSSISLSYGTMGADPQKDVLLARGQCAKVLQTMGLPLSLKRQRVLATSAPIEPGRPTLRPQIKAAYQAEYPQGHKVTGDSWKVAAYKISERLDRPCSVDTLKRSLGLKK